MVRHVETAGATVVADEEEEEVKLKKTSKIHYEHQKSTHWDYKKLGLVKSKLAFLQKRTPKEISLWLKGSSEFYAHVAGFFFGFL